MRSYRKGQRADHSSRMERSKKGSEGVTFVSTTTKDLLWDLLMVNFTLPPEVDKDNPIIAKKFKEYALKKMGRQFKGWKKRLNLKFFQKNLTPDFKGATEKIEDHWDDFVKYKTSEKAKKRSEINKRNAAKKTNHHCMGSAGYKGVIPIMKKQEADLLAKK